MRHFALYINNEVHGPLTEFEVQDLINEGKVTAETLCAPDGASDWEPLGNHFAFGSAIKLGKRLETSETEKQLEAIRLNPDDRRKLLMYGLSDASNVDQITQEQAVGILARHEAGLIKQIKFRKIVLTCSFVLALIGSLTFGLATDAGSWLLGVPSHVIAKDDPKANEALQRFDYEIRGFEEFSATAKAVRFDKPFGSQPVLRTLFNRLKIPENSAYKITGEIDLTPLDNELKKWNIPANEPIRVFIFRQPIPNEIYNKIEEQEAILNAILAPMLDDAGFEKARSEIITAYPPVNLTLKESINLRDEVQRMKLADLNSLIERVNFRIKDAVQTAESNKDMIGSIGELAKANRKWAEDLHPFLMRLKELQNRIKINVDPKARKSLWSDFNREQGAELAAWVISADATELILNDKNEFTIPESKKLDNVTASRYILVTKKISGDMVYLPWGSKFLAAKDLVSTEIPKEIFLAREEYKVVARPTTGGRSHIARYRVGDRQLIIRRESPKWFYLSVSREKDSDTLMLMVDQETYEKYPVGKVVPFDVLSKLDFYQRPMESISPSPFAPEE
jgi:hypothetical protein